MLMSMVISMRKQFIFLDLFGVGGSLRSFLGTNYK